MTQYNTTAKVATDVVADVGDILQAELKAIKSRRQFFENRAAESTETNFVLSHSETKADEKLRDYWRDAHKLENLSALCLSGGGIRSAAFALGVLQGLAERGLLERIDYLSTVSGGGYIGSLLTAWVQRQGYDEVCSELAGKQTANKSPLKYLRRYSNYLTPRTGLISTDFLSVALLYVRNLILNWLILVPLLILVIIAIKLVISGFWILPASIATIALLSVLAIVSLGFATVDSLQQRPGWAYTHSSVSRFQRFEMAPMFIGALLASCAALKFAEIPSSSQSASATVLQLGFIGAAISFIAWMVAFMLWKPDDRQQSNGDTIGTGRLWQVSLSLMGFTLGGALTGFSLGIMTLLVIQLPGIDLPDILTIPTDDLHALLLVCIGPTFVITAYFLGDIIYVGIASYTPWGEAEREWLARAASFHVRIAGAWTLATLLVFVGAFIILHLQSWTVSWIASAGGVTGVLSVIIAKASWTGAKLKERYDSWQNRSATAIVSIIAPIFIVILVGLLSATVDQLSAQMWLSFSVVQNGDYKLWIWLFGIAVAMACVGFGASLAINTNRFSLHGVYRNRLIRAFLGASNMDRRPIGFIDMDDKDNIRLADLWPNKRLPGKSPPSFLVTNCALNIVATQELAWRERKALSFTATPYSVGCGELADGSGCYRSASEYADGISLGTAMTISGAAASPNMGYHTSPALSLLLTAFNVRLGAWLGNPGPRGSRTYRYAGPFFAMKPLVLEAFGKTTDESSYVYLSDGGHFENLGLYEMVRRRCHFIIVSDGGCDPKCTFEDLGNAVRKISIDQHVTIKFRTLNIAARKEPPVPGSYCAVADIIYPDPDAKPGLLLYLKPGYQGAEPASVRSYASANPMFPHESTTDQWFGESQFEAYRALGEYVTQMIAENTPQSNLEIGRFIGAAASKLDTNNRQSASEVQPAVGLAKIAPVE